MEAVFTNLEKVTKKMLKECERVSFETAASMERYAKENKRWLDRTGDARKGLQGVANRSTNSISAGIYQNLYGTTGKEYGYWLEQSKRFNGKYAILEETRNTHAGMFFDGIEKACSLTLNRL